MLKFIVLVLAWIVPAIALASDVAGSADLPKIGRFEGSEITFYQTENYGSTVFATGPVKGADTQSTSKTVEGQIIRILYTVPEGSSALEVFRNFESRITEAGYVLEFSGEQDAYTMNYKHPSEVLPKIQMASGSSSMLYAFGTARDDKSDKFIGLLVVPIRPAGIGVQIITAETKAMENRMVDAAAMQEAIAEQGHIALYGIYFDTDSDVVKAESEPTVAEIARFLKENAGVNVIVVGHTDNQGSLDYNLGLSRRRAASVVQELSAKYGIASGRLNSAGVGYLAPVANNDSEDGRALNRRVELVKEN